HTPKFEHILPPHLFVHLLQQISVEDRVVFR
ncbi:hypothetical protein KIPB_016053, partial [Kipferlia bialata]